MRVCIFCDWLERDGDTAVTPIVCELCAKFTYPSNFVEVPLKETIAAARGLDPETDPLDTEILMASAVIRGEINL